VAEVAAGAKVARDHVVRHERDRARAGERIPEHDETERDQEEVFVTLSGSPTIVIDGEEHPAPEGTFARLDPSRSAPWSTTATRRLGC